MHEKNTFRGCQQSILKLMEIILNSQILTPHVIKKFKLLKDDCYKRLKLHGNGLSQPIEIISKLYQGFMNFKHSISWNLESAVIQFDNQPELSKHDKRGTDFLSEFKDVIQKKISDFTLATFVHGSIATNDYTGFSDADVGIIVKDEVLLDTQKLRELKRNIKEALKILLKFDNLQHHGFFIIPEGFLNYYPEDYLPIEVFKYAKTLNGTLKINIKSHRSTEQAKKSFMTMASIFTENRFRKPRNLYQVKHILSQFMLLPTLYLQAKGVYVYKKFSFELVKKEFPDTWWAMDEVSKIRRDWIRPKSKLFNTLLDTLPNPWMVSLIYRKSDWQIPDWLLRKLTPKLYQSMYILSGRMLTTIS